LEDKKLLPREPSQAHMPVGVMKETLPGAKGRQTNCWSLLKLKASNSKQKWSRMSRVPTCGVLKARE
jgi:hypothetical protein